MKADIIGAEAAAAALEEAGIIFVKAAASVIVMRKTDVIGAETKAAAIEKAVEKSGIIVVEVEKPMEKFSISLKKVREMGSRAATTHTKALATKPAAVTTKRTRLQYANKR